MPHVILDATDPEQRATAIERAADVVQQGRVVVLPTDTVYGIGCDAFDSVAVSMVLTAKHRDRTMPPPVLVASERTVEGLATDVPDYARILMRRFWPGALTVVLKAQPSLTWDLGETNGTVAVRMPDDPIALELLTTVGPMAVTSANITGRHPATTAKEAQDQLGAAVSSYLDGGERVGSSASTIIDCTRDEPIILRLGALELADLRDVLGAIELHESPEEYERNRADERDDQPRDDTHESEPTSAEDAEEGEHPRPAMREGLPVLGELRSSGVRVAHQTLTTVAPPSA